MAEIGSVIDGKYEILRKIGQGGMSVVYLAMDTHLNKQWAVKEIRKKGNGKDDVVIVNSLLAEANMMKKLDQDSSGMRSTAGGAGDCMGKAVMRCLILSAFPEAADHLP